MTINAYDWLSASKADRAKLFAATKAALDERGLSWNALYAAAFGQYASVGIAYESNFRAGTIGRKRAGLVYRWLQDHAPDRAAALLAALGGGAVWTRFLSDRAMADDIQIVRLPETPNGLVTFADLTTWAGPAALRAVLFCA